MVSLQLKEMSEMAEDIAVERKQIEEIQESMTPKKNTEESPIPDPETPKSSSARKVGTSLWLCMALYMLHGTTTTTSATTMCHCCLVCPLL